MKVKNITIGIKNTAQGLKEFSQSIKNIQRGHIPKQKKEGTYFVSVEAFHSVLTLKRLELLHVIREDKPHSIYELAHLVKRDLKNVQSDVTLLSQIGLVQINKSSQFRNRSIPRVEYDRLHVQIPVI